MVGLSLKKFIKIFISLFSVKVGLMQSWGSAYPGGFCRLSGLIDESEGFSVCEDRMRTPRSFDMVEYVCANASIRLRHSYGKHPVKIGKFNRILRIEAASNQVNF